MAGNIVFTLTELGFSYESDNGECVVYSTYGSSYNERVYVSLNGTTSEVELTREHDDITDKPPLTVKWSSWDDAVVTVLERWTA